MDSLFGCVRLDGRIDVLSDPRMSIGSALDQSGTPERAAPGPEGVVAYCGRPRFNNRPLADAAVQSDLIRQYRDVGPSVVSGLAGPFSIVISIPGQREALLAIDRMGLERLSYAKSNGLLTFATSPRDVARHLGTPSELNNQALFDFMLRHMVAAPDSVFAGVSKLLPGQFLLLRDQTVKLDRYWRPDFREMRREAPAVSHSDVLEALGDAVASGPTTNATGAFLSGGLDSSTITGLLAQHSPGPAKAFSVGFGVEEFNELEYARIAASHFGCEHFEYEVTPEDVVELIPTIASAFDEPFGNSSAVPTFCCARMAKRSGVDHLFAGDGGDELFAGNERYVRQPVFELYGRIPRLIRSAILNPIASRLDPEGRILPLQKFASYVQQARVPMPERFETWNLVYRVGIESVFDREFLQTVDPAFGFRRMRECWESCPSDDLLDKMLWYDWHYTLADSDIPKVSQMCSLAGVSVSYPMLDERVVDLSIRIPSGDKIEGRELRSFYRNAVTGFLPKAILDKEKHGFGLPFGNWLKTDPALQQLVYESLDSLRERHIINSEFVDRVAAEHRGGHAGLYGYAIWDLLMLELWLRGNRAQAA